MSSTRVTHLFPERIFESDGRWFSRGVPLLATLASIALLQLPARRAVFRRMKGVTNLLGREVTVGNWKLCNCYLARKAGVESFKVGEAVMIVVFLLVNVLGAHRVYLRFLEHYLMHKGKSWIWVRSVCQGLSCLFDPGRS